MNRSIVTKTAGFLLAFVMLGACSKLSFDNDFVETDYVRRHQVVAETVSGDFEISYLSRGNPLGQRVIFVHGTPGVATDFYQILRSVPDDLEFISLDRPGYGLTLPKKPVTSLEAQADALLPFLVERNGKKPILVGHSLGGPIIAMAAVKYGDKIAGIIQLAGALDPDLEDVWFIQKIGDIWPISRLIPKTARVANRELIDLEDELRLLAPDLSKITVPTVIIHGTADEEVPFANVAYMKATFINAKPQAVITLEGGNHYLPWEAPYMIHKAIRMLVDEDYSKDLFEAEKDSGPRTLGGKTWAELQEASSPKAVIKGSTSSDR